MTPPDPPVRLTPLERVRAFCLEQASHDPQRVTDWQECANALEAQAARLAYVTQERDEM